MLSREEHICFLATPKKDFSSPQLAKQARYYTKKIYVNQCTARVERLADPHPMRVSDTYNFFKDYLSPRHIAALENQMKPKPPVEAMSMEKALEYMEEEMRQRKAAKRVQKRRCKGLKTNHFAPAQADAKDNLRTVRGNEGLSTQRSVYCWRELPSMLRNSWETSRIYR